MAVMQGGEGGCRRGGGREIKAEVRRETMEMEMEGGGG